MSKKIKNKAGENNPNWKGGTSSIIWPTEFSRDLKTFIKTRDGDRCQFCGTEELLSIHHIDYNKQNNWEGNLVTLCQVCNPKMNKNRLSWTEYWTRLIHPKQGGVISDWGIKRMIKYGHIKIESKSGIYVGPSSVDLHLDNKARVFSPIKNAPIHIDCKEDVDNAFIDKNGWKEIVIEPGEFYILSTVEKITLSKSIAAFVHGRSSLARIGLNIHMAGFIDPMFSGNITLEVTNFTKQPIVLPKDTRVCQIVFIPTTEVVKIGYGEKKDSKYNGQEGPTLTKIHRDYEKRD